MILHRKKEGIEDALDAAGVREHPVRVLNEVLLPAMKEVGDKFGAGELILPFVLQSRRGDEEGGEAPRAVPRAKPKATPRARSCSRRCTATCTTSASRSSTRSSPTTATPCSTSASRCRSTRSSTRRSRSTPTRSGSRRCSCRRRSRCRCACRSSTSAACRFPVLIGGAAINRRFGRRALFVEGERAYESGRVLLQGCVRGTGDDGRAPGRATTASSFVAKNLDDARNDVFLHTHGRQGHRSRRRRRRARATSPRDNPVPAPPFWGTRVLRDIPLDEVFELLDLDELYRLQWGGRGSGAEYERDGARRVRADARRDSRRRRSANGWLKPQAVYGYFPAQSRGQRPHRLRSGRVRERRRLAARDRALPLPASGGPRAALPRRLLPLASTRATSTSSRSRS